MGVLKQLNIWLSFAPLCPAIDRVAQRLYYCSFFLKRSTLLLSIVVVLASVSSCAHSLQPAGYNTSLTPHVRFDKRSEFDRVLVVDEGEMRHLRFRYAGGRNQTMISLANPKAVPMEYIRMSMLGVLLTPRTERILMIGLGGGAFTSLLKRHYPSLWVDAVDIDPVVVEAAKRFFGVREDSRFHIHIEDGAAFVYRTTHTYDLIMLDIYTQDCLPSHLATPKFFNAVKAKLSDNGVVVLNLWVDKNTERKIKKVFCSIFPKTARIRSSCECNLVLFGKVSDAMPAQEDLAAAAHRLTADLDLSFDLGEIARRLRIEGSKP